MPTKEVLDSFLNYLRYELNRSELTVKSYGDDLRAFNDFLLNIDARISWCDVNADMIRQWMERMMDKGNNASSVNRRLSALRSFYRFMQTRGILKSDPTSKIDAPIKKKRLPVFVKEKEMDLLLDDLPWSDDFRDVALKTILMTFYHTGMRRAELIGLQDKDLDLVGRRLRVNGKGNKQRYIPVGEELCTLLTYYMNVRDEYFNSHHFETLFVTAKGKSYHPVTLTNMVKSQLAKVTTQQKRSPHVLRHSFATAMLNHEAGIETVKKLLGHESISTTEIYTHTTFEQLKKTYKRAHPRGQK